jgi:nicotinamide mononucleotide (NMN) deamidase PncC
VGSDPSATAAVTIAVAGIAPPAGETPTPATGTPRRALRMKKAIMKKYVL